MPHQRRPNTGFLNTRYQVTSKPTLALFEPPSDAQLWFRLDHLARIASQGRALFKPPLSNQNRLWAEFGNYIRQAAAYWKGAKSIEGSSAGLVYYYSLLNLARAELIVATPSQIHNKKITHGLSFSHLGSTGPRSDTLLVGKGVFSALYEYRTGRSLPPGTKLSVKKLMANVPEIGLELNESGVGKANTVLAYHAVLRDQTQAWNSIYVLGDGFLVDPREPATRHLLRAFREVDRPEQPVWRGLFGLSSRSMSNGHQYESRSTFSNQGLPDLHAAIDYLAAAVGPYGSGPSLLTCDLILTPSLVKSRELPMPPSLARYALMFYVSSLVRYRPAALDPVRHPDIAWLIDSFVAESPLSMLLDSTIQITGQSICYETAGYRV